jgi:Arc/MetJ-type ribon-helix-helix transcriptional regulator
MRKVLSLSLPEKTAKNLKKLSKKRGYTSVSSYVKHLVELDEELISEKELLQSVLEAREDYKTGKTMVANSMLELL